MRSCPHHVVIEHDLDDVSNADWVIDLGPDGGGSGGDLVVQGPPEQLLLHDTDGHTATALRRDVDRTRAAAVD